MKIIGHRGYSKNYPENTMLAFQKAYEIGMDGVETDVHLSKDGHLVLIHDETIDRTSNHQGNVRDYTLEELKSFNFNNKMALYETPIATLEELLDYIQNHPMILNIEVKTDNYQYPLIEEKIYQLVKSYNLLDKVVFSSFYLPSLLKLQELDKDIELGYLYEYPQDYEKARKIILDHGFKYAHPKYNYLQVEDFSFFKENNILINTWVVDSRKIAKEMLDLNINYLITNLKIL